MNSNIAARHYWQRRFSEFKWDTLFDEPGMLPATGSTSYKECRRTAQPAVAKQFFSVAATAPSQHILLLAALGVLGYKCSGVKDLCILTFLYAEAPLEGLVPVRMNDFPDLDFPGFLALVKQNFLQDRRYADYPVEKIAGAGIKERMEYPFVGMLVEGLQPYTGTFRPDLLFVFSLSGGIELKISFNANRFSSGYLDKIAGYFFDLLAALLANKERKLRDIELISPGEKQQVLFGFNETASPARGVPGDTVVAAFRRQVKLHPTKTALVIGEKEFSYEWLDNESDKAASYLYKNYGIRRGVLAGVMLERGESLLPSILGILKTGAAYVPIDAGYPGARKREIVKEAGLQVVIAGTPDPAELVNSGATVIPVPALLGPATIDPNSLAAGPAEKDLAYVLFTSGSTGRPKGVMISHAALFNYIQWAAGYYLKGERGNFPLYTSISFDLTVTSIFTPLITGNKIILYGEDQKDFRLEDLLLNRDIDVIKLTPSQLKALSYNGQLELPGEQKAKKLIVGGENLTYGLARSIYDRFAGNILIYNEYGPTESTVGCMIEEFDPEALSLSVPIGQPIDNSMIYLLDENMIPVPACVPGELYISGVGVAEGYLSQEALTRERFINNPFVEGRRLYKTGDRAVRDVFGRLLFLGRLDEQIKLRGFRIEPGEIESRLLSYAGIREAVVVARERSAGDKYLVAYYCTVEPVTEKELREHLRTELPEYMVPGAYVLLDRLPLTSNGKVDRRLLPEPSLRVADYQPPANPVEEALAAIWSAVLKLNPGQVSVTQSFFELGGHSLKAIELINRISKELGLRIGVRDLFRYNTIRSLGDQLSGLDEEEEGHRRIPRSERRDYYRLSSAQKRLYFLYEYDRQSLAYNMPQAIVLKERVDHARLEWVLQELVGRHEILRTRFVLREGEAVQEVLEQATIGVEWLFLGEGSAADLLIRDLIRPFSLESCPLLRVWLIERLQEPQILVVDMPHIITDGVSQGILIGEFLQLYNKEILPPPPLQYKDYSEWQQGEEQRSSLERQRSFWQKEYETPPPALQLPVDRMRLGNRSHAGGEVSRVLSREETESLKSLGREEGATMFMVLLSVYVILLNRLSGQDDLVVGTAVSGRRHADVEGIPGMFVNTLALRHEIKGEEGFACFVGRVRERVLACLDNQDYPYEELVDALKLDRTTGRNPLFDVVFSYEDLEEQQAQRGEVFWESYSYGEGLSKFDLVLTVWEREGRLWLNFGYSKDIFDGSTIERLAAYFNCIVAAVIKDRNVQLSEIDILPPEERTLLLESFGRGRMDYPSERSITSLFEEQVRLAPSAIAVEFGNETLTYEVLDHQSGMLARYLIGEGKKPGELIPICMRRSVSMIVSILGVLKAGGAYVPIDPNYPQDRIQFILKDIQADMVLADEGLVPPAGVAVRIVEDLLKEAAGIPGTVLPVNAPDALAYVNYTSGSMGYPKGVMVRHRSVARLLSLEDIEMNASTVTLQLSSISFDAATFEIWVSLLRGGKLVVYPYEEVDPPVLNGILKEYKVNTLWLTSGLLDQWCESGFEHLSIRYLLAGGDVVHPQTVRKLYDRLPGIKIYNGYGPTENTTFTCCYHIPPGFSGAAIPIGRPISGTTVYVLDRYLKPVPPGVAGALFAAGAGLARGYVNNEKLTNEKFIDNPFVPGASMYATGDRVRWLSDGNMEFLGRLDEQIKLRGFRIEPGEIESRLLSYAGIREAVVVAQERSAGDKYLVAYYCTGEPVTEKELREHLRTELPEYMVPAVYVLLDRLPLTTNGKVDRRLLPEPSLQAEDYQPPANPVEEALAAIWSAVLKLNPGQVSVTQSFFELGGHSLKAMELINRMSKEMGLRIGVRELFRYSSIRSLGDHLSARDETAGKKEEGHRRIPRSARRDYYRLSSAQKRLYFLYEYDRQSLAYNVPQAIVLKERVDHARLESALQELVGRHEILRTRFVLREGEAVQEVLEQATIGVERLFLGEGSAADLLIRDLIRPFSLECCPLLRVWLIERLHEPQILVVDMPHIITDGVSQGILIGEFLRLYNKEVLPPPPLQYKDYSEWQQGEEQRSSLERQRSFWQKEYETLPPALQLPVDRVRLGNRSHAGGEVSRVLSREETERLEALGREEGTTMFVVLLSVYVILLNRLSGQDDLVVGTAVSGRRHADVEGIPGMFVNTLALRHEIKGKEGFAGFVGKVRERVLACLDNQDYPYEELVDALKLDRTSGRNPLFDAAFSYQVFEERQPRQGEVSWEPYGYGEGMSKSDLVLSVWEREGRLWLSFSYSKDIFDGSTIERLAAYFNCIVAAVIKDRNVRVSEIDILPPEERTLLLESFGRGIMDYPPERSITSLFEEQVRLIPDAIAIVAGRERISYRQLNLLAEQLSSYLMRQGVKTEEPVGICMDRSVSLVVGLLGILKAGGAYVPLDPGYPPDRIAYMLEDSGARFVLSSRKNSHALPAEFQVILFEDDDWRSAEKALAGEGPEIRSDQLAYIVYTSGSTGKPKGVMIEHRGMVNLASWHNRTLEITRQSRITSMANISFDAFGIELWPHLIKGACLYMVSDELRLDPGRLFDFCREQGITHSYLPTPLVGGFLDASENKASSLQCIWTGGDRLQLRPGVWQPYRLLNSYGPAENTVAATAYEVDWSALQATPLIGTPIDNVSIYILDKGRQLCPVGMAGEICVGGIGLARGYWNNPGLTASKFSYELLGGKEGQRVYRTGDLGRWTADGNIEFLGRLDEQVKIRGQRIEPGEIESQLSAYEGIRESVVVVKEKNGDKYLAAYYVSDKEIEPAALRKHLRLTMPAFMVPAFFCHLKTMPITPNGKVDRKALPEDNWSNSAGYVTPVDETQQWLVEIWSNVLGLEKESIGIATSFFDIGGNSLKLVSLTHEIDRRFPDKMTIGDLFEFPTIGQQARYLDDAAGMAQHKNESSVFPDQVSDMVRLFEQ